MSEPIFYEENREFLSLYEVQYWKRMFLSSLKIGVEIEAEVSYGADTKRRHISDTLKPTNNNGRFGDCGVYKVTSDGSLSNGGIEVCTIGRRLSFLDLYAQYKHITNLLIEQNFYITERCGLHNHILFSYYDRSNELEKPVPDIIMKNFFQLTRRYIPALVWITATPYREGDANLVTRYEQFCRTGSLLGITPKNRTFKRYIEKVRNSSDGGRYQFCNVRPLQVSEEGTTIMHMEMRFPDGSLYPAQIAAQNILFASLFIKSIELSQIGLISTGSSEYWNETKSLYARLRQGEGWNSNRFSRAISQEDRVSLQTRASDMLDELKHAICSYDPVVYRILKVLADTPITTMRHEKTDIEINNAFNVMIKNFYEDNLEDCVEVIKEIQIQGVNKCISLNQWMFKVSEKLSITYEDIQKSIERISKKTPIEFDTQLGIPYFK